MKENYTHLSLVVDRSGSMQGIHTDAAGGINALIKEQAAVEGQITVTLYQFDDRYEKVFGPILACDSPTYVLSPRGMTALLDATGKAITETGEFLSTLSEDKRPDRVVFVIVTDGYENASKEFTKDKVKALIETQTKQWNWEFVYLAANIDAFSEAGQLGVSAFTQYKSTPQSTRSAYAGVSSAMSSARAGGQSISVSDNLPSEV